MARAAGMQRMISNLGGLLIEPCALSCVSAGLNCPANMRCPCTLTSYVLNVVFGLLSCSTVFTRVHGTVLRTHCPFPLL